MSKLNTEFKTEDESPGLLLWRVSMEWQKLQRESLASVGLTHVQFVLLACLGWLEENQSTEISQAVLSAHAKTDLMMTSQVVRTLERKKYLHRQRSKIDARAYVLKLTTTGWKIVQKAMPIVEGVDKRYFSILKENHNILLTCLKTLKTSLQNPIG